MSDHSEPHVIVRRQGRIGRLTLNRPRALNALTLDMIRLISAALDQWRDDPAIHAVVLDAAGTRAFCAGGDIRWIRELSAAGAHAEIERFFIEEYALNLAIARYEKPYVSLIDAICMGGGIGLSVHGAIRVATPAAQFAMPETAIGLFPDIGASFILPRLRGVHGMHLGLTGARVGGAEATWLGLATHLVPTLEGLADAIAESGIAAIPGAAMPPPPTPDTPGIEAFAATTVPGIIEALHAQGTEWSRTQLASLHQVSPSALLWTFELIRRGARQTLEQCQATELALTRHTVRHPDFLEGVRAMVVDKDRAPKWSPATIEAVDPAQIAAMFTGAAQ